jgi:sterol desaturase/sphingolipid hydroxylase (fatty acid hydroxylase superfamily)
MGWLGFLLAVWHRVGYTQIGLLALGSTMTVIGAIYTFLTHAYPEEPRTLRGFLRFCLPPHILLAQQTRLDLVYATIKKAVRILWGWAFVSNITCAYFFYGALGHLLGGSAPATPLDHAPTGVEGALFLAIGIVVLDFYTFFAHYLLHKLPLMWTFHKVHHSALTLIPVTNLRFHPVQEVWDALWNNAGVGAWIALFSYLTSSRLTGVTILGINALILISCFSFHHLRHSHIYMRYPIWLERVVMSPAQHQIHHSREIRHLDQNFGLFFSCWDQLFGTIAYSEPMPAANLGLTEAQQNYRTVWNLFAMPFVELGQKSLRWLHGAQPPIALAATNGHLSATQIHVGAMELPLYQRVAVAAIAALALWSVIMALLLSGAHFLAAGHW